MTAKKDESVLGLAPLARTGNGSFPDLSSSFSAGGALTKTEQRIVTESHKQSLVIQAQTAKTVLAMDMMADMHQHGADEFYDTAQYLSTVRQKAAGKDYQPQVDEFTHRDAQLVSQHLLGAIEVGAHKVAEEVHRSLYLPDPPDEKRGVIKRLLGG